MHYTDGFDVDEKYRLTICPVCDNDEFSERSNYCHICGQFLFNRCEGGMEEDYQGNFHEVHHDNPGNARFCEVCGNKTRFLNESILKPWEEVKATLEGKGRGAAQ